MQTVSRAYKNSIRKIGRNRGYIRITIGITNSDAQKNIECKESENSLFYLADPKKIFSGYTVTKEYATCEHSFSRVDGSMYFAPATTAGLYNNGIISEDILGAIKITFGSKDNLDIKGLMIDFSECYPTAFTIENDTGTKSYTNESRYFTTEDAFNGTSFLIITPTAMVNTQGRLRIYSMTCGVANTFTNNELITYSNKEYVSSLSETVPSNDVSFSVDNKNQYYSPDDPDSALSYMEIGQEVKVAFGYDTNDDGNIEWLPEQTTYLKTWSADNDKASFTATDRFDYFNSTYYKGLYRPAGISLYDLAEDVFDDMGLDSNDYFIDSYLETVIVKNPIPPVSHASALQIIANAGRCTLSEDRNGRINIQSSFIPDMTSYSENETEYSHAENVLGGTAVQSYAEASENYSTVNGTMIFVGDPYLDTTGFVSEEIADENGYFDNNPTLTVELEATYAPYSLGISFVGVHPEEITLRTYANGTAVQTIQDTVTDLDYVYDNRLTAFDKLVIEFTKGSPNSRIFVDNIAVGSQSDYYLQKNHELSSYPLATRQTKLKSISVTRNVYKASSEQIDLFTDTVTLNSSHNTHTVYFARPSYNCTVTSSTVGVTATITDSSSYFATITFSGLTASDTEVEYTLSGYEYVVEEQAYVVQHNANGEDKTWNNPLISTTAMAQDLEEWLASFYLGDLEYEIDWRGDPRVDANDLFYLETRMGSVPIRGYENTLNFSNSGWSGRMKARKVVIEE